MFTAIRSTEEEPSSTPAASPRLPRSTSPWPPGPAPTRLPGRSPPPDRAGAHRARPISARFEPVCLSRGVITLIPRVLLSVTLAGPTPSGSTGASRLCQGCSRPPRHLPDQAAPSSSRPTAIGTAVKVSHLHSNRQRGPRLIGQPLQPPLDEPAPPPGYRARRHPQLGRGLLVAQPPCAGQHDLRPQRQRLRAVGPPCPAGELITLVIGQRHSGFRPPRALTIGQPGQPGLREPPPPLAHRHRGHPELGGDPLVHRARLGARQHDPRPRRTPARPARPGGKLLAFLLSQRQAGGMTSHTDNHTKLIRIFQAHDTRVA